ncbi:MAG: O-antigen ligase family protein [bacterium]
MNQIVKQSSYTAWLLKIIRTCATLALFTPFVFSMYFHHPFDFVQVTIFQILIFIMVAAWILLIVADRKYRPNWKNPLIIAVTIFLLSLLVTLPFSVDPWLSFWSDYRRMGVFNYILYWFWFIILSSTNKTWTDWRSLLIVTNGVALAIGAVGITQVNGMLDVSTRVIATIGNPLYLAAYALLHIFIAIYLYVTEQRSSWKRFFALSALVHFCVLILTASRGPTLAFCVAAAIGAALFICLSKLQRKKKKLLAVISIIILITTVSSALWMRSPSGKAATEEFVPPLIARMLYSDFGFDRLALWSIALDSFKERPIAGWGLEMFELPFNARFDPVNTHTNLIEQWYDRVHNQYLDMLVATGIVGVAAFLSIWIVLFWTLTMQLWRNKDHKQRLGLIALFILFTAHVVQQIFAFDTPAAALITYLLLAFATFAISHNRPLTTEPANRATGSRRLSYILIAPILLLTLFAQYKINFTPAVKNYQKLQGRNILSSDHVAALQYYRSSVDTKTHLIHEIRKIILGELYPWGFDAQITSPELEELTKFISEEMEKSANERTYDFLTLYATSQAYRLYGEYNPEALDRAEYWALQAIDLAPMRSEGYEELAEIALARGDIDSTVSWYVKAFDRAQETPKVYGALRLRFAEMYMAMGDFEEGFHQLSMARDMNYDIYTDTRLAVRIADSYTEEMDIAQAVEYLDQVGTFFKTNAATLRARAKIHAYASEYITAQILLDKLNLQDPALAEQTREELGM